MQMAAELQQSVEQMPSPPAAATTAATEAAPTPSNENPGQNPPPKRQRRPSVRLGEIGDQPATLRARNPLKLSKTRPVTNLVNGHDFHTSEDNDGNIDFGNRRTKSRRAVATKRVRSSWVSKDGEGVEGGNHNSKEENNAHSGEFRDLDSESPVLSADADADVWHRRSNDATELDNFPDSNSREQRFASSEGVRSWLAELGLSRYAPVFEIHEVDDEVLPLLTLEDLKDMGINAVGSRRKLYAAIQKLRRGYS